MRNTKLPSIFGVLFLLAGLAAGVLTVRYKKEYRTNANVDLTPKDVRITNISDLSFTVTWTTNRSVSGFVEYKTGGESTKVELDKIENDQNHFVVINNLQPLTEYTFKIGSDEEIFDNNGTPWQTKTGTKINGVQNPQIASGKITDENGNPLKNALVYITSQSSSTISAYTSEKGAWIINLSDLRNLTLDGQFEMLPDSILEISVQKEPAGSTSAKILAENSNPVPTMSIGSLYDFRNEPDLPEANLPSAVINLPNSTESAQENTNEVESR